MADKKVVFSIEIEGAADAKKKIVAVAGSVEKLSNNTKDVKVNLKTLIPAAADLPKLMLSIFNALNAFSNGSEATKEKTKALDTAITNFGDSLELVLGKQKKTTEEAKKATEATKEATEATKEATEATIEKSKATEKYISVKEKAINAYNEETRALIASSEAAQNDAITNERTTLDRLDLLQKEKKSLYEKWVVYQKYREAAGADPYKIKETSKMSIEYNKKLSDVYIQGASLFRRLDKETREAMLANAKEFYQGVLKESIVHQKKIEEIEGITGNFEKYDKRKKSKEVIEGFKEERRELEFNKQAIADFYYMYRGGIDDTIEGNKEKSEVLKKEGEAIVESFEKAIIKSDGNIEKLTANSSKSFGSFIGGLQKGMEKVVPYIKMGSEKIAGVGTELSKFFKQEVADITEELTKLAEKQKKTEETIKKSTESVARAKQGLKDKQVEYAKASTAEEKAALEEQIKNLDETKKNEMALLAIAQEEKKNLDDKKEKLEEKKRKKEKQQKRTDMAISIVTATASIAEGISKSLAKGGIVGPILAAIVASMGAVQLTIMGKQLGKLEDGGLLQGKRHRNGGMRIEGSNIEVEGGEYVVNRESTSRNLGLMRYINSQRKELSMNDMQSFFARASKGYEPAFSRQFANGGELPTLANEAPSVGNDLMVDAIKAINFKPRVAVTDILRVQEGMNNVNTWVGM